MRGPNPRRPTDTDRAGVTALQAIARFAGHVFAGSMILLIGAVPAVLLHALVYSVPWPADFQYVVAGLKTLEYAIFGIDLTFVAYLLVSAYRLIKEMRMLPHREGERLDRRPLSKFSFAVADATREFVAAAREGLVPFFAAAEEAPRIYCAPLVAAFRSARSEAERGIGVSR